MTLRHMKIFVSVYQNNGITRASEELHLAQPSVSLAIRELEDYYGIRLFDRISRRLYVTEQGRMFYDYALHIVSLFDEMELGIRNWEHMGTLRIGSSITIGNFLADPNLDTLYQTLTAAPAAKAAAPETTDEPAAQDQGLVIQAEDIQLGLPSVDKETAIRAAGALLAKRGYVDADYADAMVEREKLVTTYMGMGVAIPHGTSEKKSTVKKSGVVMLQYPDGVDFGDEKAYLIFGIAGVGDAHLDLLAHVCEVLEDEEALEMMKKTPDIKFVLTHLQ